MNNSSNACDHFHTEQTPSGLRYVFPYRNIGRLRWGGPILAAIGLASIGFVILVISVWWGGGQPPAQQGWLGWAVALALVLFLMPVKTTTKMLATGLAIFTNRTRSELEVGDNGVWLYERCFFVRWRWQIAEDAREIEDLQVGPARLPQSTADDVDVLRWLGDHSSALFAEVSGQEQRQLLVGCYPQSMMEDLAKDLERQLPNAVYNRQAFDPRHQEDSQDARQRFQGASPVQFASQPATSDIVVEQHETGVTYHAPAAGVWNGNRGLLVFAIFWNAFVAGFMGVFVSIIVRHDAPGLALLLGFPLMLIPFVGVGIWTILYAINLGSKKTAMVTAGDELFVVTEGLFGKHSRQFHRDDLRAILVGPSGLAVNDVPVMELQFRSAAGKFGVLSERDNDELEWLAWELSQSMGLVEAAPAP